MSLHVSHFAAQMLATEPTQAPTITTTSTVAVSSVGTVLLAIAVWYVMKHRNAKGGHLALGILLGVMLSGSAAGGAIRPAVGAFAGAVTSVVSSI